MTKQSRPFSESDRQRFATLKAELGSKLPRSLPDSEAIFECARVFVEIRDREYYQIDDADEAEAWMHATYGVGPHQAAKYFRVGTRLTEEEVHGKHQGLEAMDQIALTPLALRPAMWEVAEAARLSAGALCAGRLAAVPYVQKKQMKRAVQALLAKAKLHAQYEAQEAAARRAAPRATPVERIEAGLDREIERLEQLLAKDDGVTPEEAERLGAKLDRLAALRQGLAARTLKTSAGPETQSSPDVGGKLLQQGPEPGPVAAVVMKHLGPLGQAQLGQGLFAIVQGAEVRKAIHDLRRIVGAGWTKEQAGPRAALDRWLAGLSRAKAEDRRLLALHLAVAARLPGHGLALHMLRGQSLPPRLRDEVERLCQHTPMFPPGDGLLSAS